MTETIQDQTPTNLKNQITAKQVIQGFIEGKNLTQISTELGITRAALYARLDKQEAQTIMYHEVRQLETRLLQQIETMLNSQSPIDRRVATQELGKITKHVQDKVYPSLLRTENLNINIDITPYKQQQQLHTETLNRLPPTQRQQYWNTYNQVKKDWNIP